MSITPGPWKFKPYAFTDEVRKQMESVGIKPTRSIGNDGSVAVVTTGEDRRLIATVASQTEFKRGKGHEVECLERDTNARAIAEVPSMIEALKAYISAGIGNSTDFEAQSKALTLSRAILKRIEG